MILRSCFAFLFSLILLSNNIIANEFEFFRLKEEPVIRIGLSTNARSVSITTSDTSLVSVSPDEQPNTLATNRITVSPRAYRPPIIENYYFEITDVATKEEADQIAQDAKEATGENSTVKTDSKTQLFRVRVGEMKDSLEEANAYKDFLSEKGFESEIVIERIVAPSNEALALSQQLANKSASTSEVRSLIKSTSTSQPTTAPNAGQPLDPNLKEILVSGGTKFSSFKPIAFGSLNERAVPVRYNGKAYRGKIEVFVNNRGSLTVVNVVAMEDYLRGVVPNELGLPAIEAQKAQAVAARTYAWANMNGFASQGFDLLPTTQSQVYRGYSSESTMPSQAIAETRGIVATYHGKPINAMYTSTCGGRTENVENIYPFNEPYLRGTECSFEGKQYFDPFLIKTSREVPKIDDENQLELVRISSQFAVNGFVMSGSRYTDEWFDDAPTSSELTSWANQLAMRFAKPFPSNANDLAKPAEFANFLAKMIYSEGYADTLLSDSDITYQLSFEDGKEIDKDKRANIAILFRDGWLSLYPDSSFRPNKPMSRSRLIRLIYSIYSKKKWLPGFQSGVTKSSVDGKLVLRSGKSDKQLFVRPDVFLFRQFGDTFYQVKETALIGGESVSYQTNALGEVTYLEVKPTQTTTTPESVSPFTYWTANLSASAVQSRLSRYVRGIGTLIDVNVKAVGYSRRAIELEIIGTNGRFSLKSGKIRSALRLKEQLFVMNKRYGSNGRVISYSFTGRGWGHGIGMCQYGAFGLAKQGYKYDKILKHYYTGIELTKAY